MKNFLRSIVFIFIVYCLLSIVIQTFRNNPFQNEVCRDQFEVINSRLDRLHKRSWNYGTSKGPFCSSYETLELQSKQSELFRTSISSYKTTYNEYWGDVYKKLVEESKPHLGFIIDSLSNVAIEKELSKEEQANLIVSFIQDIPYSYILSRDCSYEETSKHPCVGNASLGILSPYEFIHSLHGDCDTRSVLIYAILEEMGFDPMIVISREYAHAMLAINMPAVGDHLTFKEKNYYFWETTAKNWPVGVLPPSSNNVNYWKIALVNEL